MLKMTTLCSTILKFGLVMFFLSPFSACGTVISERMTQHFGKRSINSVESNVKTSHALNCYDGSAGKGNLLKATDYIPALRMYGFEDRIRSCCFTGIWILYAKENYNKLSPSSANWWAYGDNYCTNVPAGFGNKASSMRFTGAPDDWKYDTLNLYFENFFIGSEEYMYNDKTSLRNDNRAKSIIVTGCSAWTLYQYDNYQGEAVCVFPSHIANCNPGFYSSSQQLGVLAGQVSSVRRGCFSQQKAYPENNGIMAPQNVSNWIFPSKK
eukprot:GFUD01037634.1.p1 GENE.GFUD01037634.1~~GFUD01037634.1.p1  ORF type:complete len:267 (+),score=20.63 GFUD01037634.1:80-880(+)